MDVPVNSGPMDLYTDIKKILDETRGRWPRFARGCTAFNPDVPINYRWLEKVANNEIKDPSVRKCQAIFNYYHAVWKTSAAA